MANLILQVASGEPFDIRTYRVEQAMSACFTVSVLAHTENPDVDFDEILGKPASFTMMTARGPRTWSGLCNHAEQAAVEETGVSTYRLTLVPSLWLLTQRRNHRMFQQMSEIDIVQKLLGEWGIEPQMRLDAATYKKRKYKVQYAESDFDFVSRLLEDVGVSFYFEQNGAKTELVLDDGPQHNSPRPPLPFNPKAGNSAKSIEHVSALELAQRVRPGKYTVRDHDYRRPPTYELMSTATGGLEVEKQLERFHYNPGAFLFKAEPGGDSPTADDRGAARTDEKEGARQAERRLSAKRAQAKRASFTTNAYDLAPGSVYTLMDHPRADLGAGKPQLVIAASIHGSSAGEAALYGTSVSGSVPFHPPVHTAKPRTQGVESATVVGPDGEEIHTDEFGRVRVQFHWDREGQFDENSSCWIHVNQPWGGAGYGGSALPRIGQEVLVDFLGGDPDRPVVIGRVYTALQTTPYQLPANKTQSGLRSNSTGGGGGYNELMFEDKNGSELFRTHAQKDHLGRVNNDSSASIGRDRDRTVGRHNTEAVIGNESIVVVGDRTLNIGGKQTHTVMHDNDSTSQEGSTNFTSKENWHSTSKKHLIEVSERLEIVCGSSRILMTPNMILLDAPRTYVNPGPEAAAAASASGSPPLSEDEKKALADAQKRALEKLQVERETQAEQLARTKHVLATYKLMAKQGAADQKSVDTLQATADQEQASVNALDAQIAAAPKPGP